MKFFNSDSDQSYLPGTTKEEKNRLNEQSHLLWDAGVDSLIKDAGSIIELGCGPGSTVEKIRSINPNTKFIGFDYSADFIKTAKSKWKNQENTNFFVADATSQGPEISRFQKQADVVIIRLVLWCTGKSWSQLISTAKSLLKPGGHLALLEPDDRLLFSEPAKPNFQKVIELWQELAFSKGQDPFIGTKVPAELTQQGLEIVSCSVLSNLAVSCSEEHFENSAINLENLFLSTGPEPLGLKMDDPVWIQAIEEIRDRSPGQTLHDGYISMIAKEKSK